MVRKAQPIDGGSTESTVVEKDPSPYKAVRHCIFCGPRTVRVANSKYRAYNVDEIVCPSCGYDPITARSIQNVIDNGFEACYIAEVRRAKEKV